MRLFLDSSVLLAASGSAKGASRFLVEHGTGAGWTLLSSHYCHEETQRNLPKLGPTALHWFAEEMEATIEWQADALSAEQAVIFPKAKDRPVLVTALAAKAAVLLTLDRADFQTLLGSQFYGMRILTPGDWLTERREAGEI